jgi:hypothetical protein
MEQSFIEVEASRPLDGMVALEAYARHGIRRLLQQMPRRTSRTFVGRR